MTGSSNSSGNGTILDFLNGGNGLDQIQNKEGETSEDFALSVAVSLGLFTFEILGFFLLKSSAVGRRI